LGKLQAEPLALSRTQKNLILLSIGLGVFMSTLDVGIINVALPTLVQAFDTSFPTTQWAVLSYQLVSSGLVLGAILISSRTCSVYFQLALMCFCT
jgi:MFS family permease